MREERVQTFVYPLPLTPHDKLTDGPPGERLPLTDNTLLMWVDLVPPADFAHPTRYVLISADRDIRVEDGEWWPMLNGREIFHGDTDTSNLILESPFVLSGGGDEIRVHAYPFELVPGDRLEDGSEKALDITARTRLFWVDLEPTARFSHPTAYILISDDKRVRLEQGGWWPVVNGKPIHFRVRDGYGLILGDLSAPGRRPVAARELEGVAAR